MKRFSFFLALGLLAAASIFQSCQKDELNVANPTNPSAPSSDRAAETYGVSVFSAGNPSLLHTMDVNGTVVASVQVYFFNSSGTQIFVNDLKGVCVANGAVLVSTGFDPIDAYSNMILRVDPHTGFGNIMAYSPSVIGTVSDIDYDPITDLVYGLRNNTNTLISINLNTNAYTSVGAITGLGASYVAKGLTMVRNNVGGTDIIVAATRATGGAAQVYSVLPTAGPATFLSAINPAAQLANAHCGVGYDVQYNRFTINRRGSAGFGLNSLAWGNPPLNPSAFWGGTGINFEDLSSDN